jgi:arylsulfatase
MHPTSRVRNLALAGICLLAALLLVLFICGCGGKEPAAIVDEPVKSADDLRLEAAGANLVICVLDAARPDHFGCYGYERRTTPSIDSLAEEGIVFDRHYCQATYTGVSTPALFTGQYPHTHGVTRHRHLGESVPTMARLLESAGFHTVLLSSNGMVSPDGPYRNGTDFMDTYTWAEIEENLQPGEERHYSVEPVLRLFTDWVHDHSDRRFFAYIHLTPPHGPYHMPGRFRIFRGLHPPGYDPESYQPGVYESPVERENVNTPPTPEWLNLYDDNLLYGDWAVGELMRILREAGVFERTLLAVTADHGEAFGEHGFVKHGAPPYEEVTRIPLVVRLPGGGIPLRVGALTETIDLLPTVCDLFKVDYPEDVVQGMSLLPLISGSADKVRNYAFTLASEDKGKYVVRSERYALILWGNGIWRELYDLENDPAQRVNILDESPEVAGELVAAFSVFAESQTYPPVRFLGEEERELADTADTGEFRASPEVMRDLRALGYIR